MLFQSYIFIFLFLPIVLVGYYGLNHYGKDRLAKVFLMLSSFAFYAYANFNYVILLAGSILVNYGLLQGLKKSEIEEDTPERVQRKRKRILALGIALNVGFLFYYKYYGFFLSNMNRLFDQNFVLDHVLLPLGISFFTFQQITVLVDEYREEAEITSFLDYALYISCFPHLLSGPIPLAGEMIPQYNDPNRKKIDFGYLKQGIILFTIGLFKKIILADAFATGADWGYGNISQLDTISVILTSLFFALQVYFDFSGYSDMARGVGKLLHLDLPINFDSPFKAGSYGEFWRRWHISLYRFMTRYLYIPLGGSRKGNFRQMLNTMIIFTVSGLWHGAQWTFITWGVVNGVLVVLSQKGKHIFAKIPSLVQRLLILTTFTFTTIFFRISQLQDVDDFFRKLCDFKGMKINESLVAGFNLDEFWYLIKIMKLDQMAYSTIMISVIMTVLAIVVLFLCENSNQIAEKENTSIMRGAFYAVIFIWSIISLSAVNSFIYFNF